MESFRSSLVWHDRSASGSAKGRLPDLKKQERPDELVGVRDCPVTGTKFSRRTLPGKALPQSPKNWVSAKRRRIDSLSELQQRRRDAPADTAVQVIEVPAQAPPLVYRSSGVPTPRGGHAGADLAREAHPMTEKQE